MAGGGKTSALEKHPRRMPARLVLAGEAAGVGGQEWAGDDVHAGEHKPRPSGGGVSTYGIFFSARHRATHCRKTLLNSRPMAFGSSASSGGSPRSINVQSRRHEWGPNSSVSPPAPAADARPARQRQ